MKLGLALGGGGARGFAHLGIVRALHELNIPIYCVAGTSIGAIIGGTVAAGAEEKAYQWINMPDWVKLPKLFLDVRLPWQGLIHGSRIVDFLSQTIGAQTFRDLRMPFAAIATDYNSGEEVVLTSGDVIKAIRASMSIPGVFKPVKIGERILMDGGLVNPVPVDVCRSLGADKVIAVDVNAESLRNATRNIDAINIIDAVDAMFTICSNRIARSRDRECMPDLLLCPKVRNIKLLDFRGARELFVQGYEYAMLRRSDIRKLAFLE